MPESPCETGVVALGHDGVGGHFEAEAPKLEAPAQVDVLAHRQLLGEPADLIEGPSAHGQVGTEAGGEESQLPGGGRLEGARPDGR